MLRGGSIEPRRHEITKHTETQFRALRDFVVQIRRPLRRVSNDTTISTMNPSGIVMMPGWLNGTGAGRVVRYRLVYASPLSRIHERLVRRPTVIAAVIPC